MPNKQEKMTAFGQFRILKIGTKYIQAELIGSVKNYQAQLVKNAVLSDIEIGATIFLRVNDQSTQNRYGTKVQFEPIELLTDQAEIEKYILADRKRVAEIYIQAAQENLDKGWYSGDAIDKALFFSASHPTYKPINIELRHRRLKNIIHACCNYQHKTTEHFIHLCRATIDMYKDEQRLSDLELSQFEQSIIKIQSDLNLSEENAQQKANEYLSQLKGLLKS
jgi:hypothetical protein